MRRMNAKRSSAVILSPVVLGGFFVIFGFQVAPLKTKGLRL